MARSRWACPLWRGPLPACGSERSTDASSSRVSRFTVRRPCRQCRRIGAGDVPPIDCPARFEPGSRDAGGRPPAAVVPRAPKRGVPVEGGTFAAWPAASETALRVSPWQRDDPAQIRPDLGRYSSATRQSRLGPLGSFGLPLASARVPRWRTRTHRTAIEIASTGAHNMEKRAAVGCGCGPTTPAALREKRRTS
jgi:hypothetical protein